MNKRWQEHGRGLWWREDPSGTVVGFFLCEGVPLGFDGTPSPRLSDGWRDHVAAGVQWWWRIDGPEEEWRPAGAEQERSAEHAGAHVCMVELSVTDHSPGPCPECKRLDDRARQKREAA